MAALQLFPRFLSPHSTRILHIHQALPAQQHKQSSPSHLTLPLAAFLQLLNKFLYILPSSLAPLACFWCFLDEVRGFKSFLLWFGCSCLAFFCICFGLCFFFFLLLLFCCGLSSTSEQRTLLCNRAGELCMTSRRLQGN